MFDSYYQNVNRTIDMNANISTNISSSSDLGWDLKIRNAQVADADTIFHFNLQLADCTSNTPDPESLYAGVLSILNDRSRGSYILAYNEMEVLGQILVLREWNDWRNGWIWWLDNIYVKKEVRRKGVLTGMFTYLSQLAIESRDVVGFRLHVAKDNCVAQAIYEHFGFAPNRIFMQRTI
jgi:GNAT superfamily N-acetyltransferase